MHVDSPAEEADTDQVVVAVVEPALVECTDHAKAGRKRHTIVHLVEAADHARLNALARKLESELRRE